MAVFSDQRFSLPMHEVATPRSTAPVDTSTAEAISAFGDIGGELRAGAIEGELVNDLQQTGNIINTLNQGYPAIQEAIESGNINPNTDRFYNLSLAAQQGKISQQRAAIEAEVILRESISKAPGFADQFRKTARETLGFDPSSASLNTLFLSGPDANKVGPLTQADKDMQQAQAMFAGGAVPSVERGFQLIQQERADELREGIQGSKIQRGELNAGKVAVEGARRATSRFNNVMLGAFQQIKSTGGVVDIESFRGAIMSQADMVKSKLEQEMSASEDYIYKPEHYNHVLSRVDEQRDSYLEILNNQDLTNVLARNSDRLSDLVEIAGINLAPALAILAPLGEPAQQAGLDMMLMAGDDPKILQELVARDPRNAFVGNLLLEIEDIAPGLRGLAEGNLPAMVAEGRLDGETARAIGVVEAGKVVDGRTTAAEIGKIFDGLKGVEMERTALDMVSQTAQRSYQEMTTDERASVSDSVRQVSQAQMSNISRALSNARLDGLRLGFKNGKFVITDPQARRGTDLPIIGPFGNVQGPRGFATDEAEQQFITSQLTAASGAEEALDYLNESLLPIVNNPNWQREMGIDSADEYVQGMVQQVNFAQMDTEVKQGGPILESMDPAQVGQFRQAWQDRDVQKVMEILGTVPQAGIDPDWQGFQPRPATQAAVLPEVSTEGQVGFFNKNPLPAGLTRSEQMIADNEALHDPKALGDKWDGKTVAWGFDLEANPRAAAMKEQYGLTGMTNEEIAQHFVDNPDQARELLQSEIKAHRDEFIEKTAAKYPGIYNDLDEVRQAALDNIVYNMGVGNVLGFPTMLKALSEAKTQEDFDLAATNLLLTQDPKTGKWEENKDYTKVGARAGAMAYMLLTGEWPTSREQGQQFLDEVRKAMEEANAG